MISQNVICDHCDQVNRVRGDRAAEKARCGGCGQFLFVGLPHAVDEAGYERHVTRSDIPLLVDVWAPWCGPCRAMAPQFLAAAKLLEPEVRLLKLNSDEAPTLSTKLNIRSIPTLLLVRKGHIVARSTGLMDTRRIVEWTRAHLARPHVAL